MSKIEKLARAAIAKHGLHPLEDPMGDANHTDAPIIAEDREFGELAFHLGGLFTDKDADPDAPLRETYWYNEMTSCDVWTRVARALRIHGLKIVDR